MKPTEPKPVNTQDRPTAKHYIVLAVLVFAAVAALPYAVGTLLWACTQIGL
jgi:hypothetical protein